MNPDNPYAAPQIVEPRLAVESLPVATMIARQHYSNIDTLTLVQYEKLSRSIEWATILWVFPMMLSIVSGLITSSMGGLTWLNGTLISLFAAVSLLRLHGGRKRKSSHRWVVCCADGLLLAMFLGLGVLIVFSFGKAPARSVLGLGVLGLFATMLFNSIRAALNASILFGPQPYLHQPLAAEVEYRCAHKID